MMEHLKTFNWDFFVGFFSRPDSFFYNKKNVYKFISSSGFRLFFHCYVTKYSNMGGNKIVSPSPFALVLFTTTWVHDPGAHPQSTTTRPGFNNLCLSSISSNLNALLHLQSSSRAFLTYGSLICRCIQSCELCFWL